MQKLLALNDFAKAGLNTDLLPWDLPGSFLTEVGNVRIVRGKLSPFGGYKVWDTLPTDFDPGFIMHVGTGTNEFWILAGIDNTTTATAVYVYDGTTFSDISNADGYSAALDEDLWQGCMLSSIPVINNPGHYPEYWASPPSTGTPVVYLPWDASNTWADEGENCKIIRSHKQYLFALDLQSGLDEYPDGVRWSSPADIGSIPATWDPTDQNNVAGLTFLGADGGKIIDGLSLRDSFVVYRERSISVFDFVGGQFVWRIRHLTSTHGLMSKNCIVEIRGKHYLISDGDILVNDGTNIKSLMHNRIRKEFVDTIDTDNYINSYVVKNNVASEIWFCIPQSGSVYPDLAYIYNWEDNSWSKRDLPDTPFAGYGPLPSDQYKWGTGSSNDIPGTWNTTPLVWNERETNLFNETIVSFSKSNGLGTSGELRLLDVKNVESDANYNTVIERVGFALEGLSKVTTITRIYPHMRGPGTVKIEAGSQDYPGAPVRWKPPVTFDPITQRKVDIRTTGELHCFRFTDEVGNNFWEISGIDIEYVEAGRR